MVAIAPHSSSTSPLPEVVGRAIVWPRRHAAVNGARAIRRDDHGSALVEMALVLPTFFMLLFGIFTYSMVLFGRGNAICAANMAAHYAAVHSSTALVPSTLTSIKSYATGFLYAAPTSGTSVNTTYSAGNSVGGTVTVVVSVTYPTVIPFYGGGSVTVSSTALRTITR